MSLAFTFGGASSGHHDHEGAPTGVSLPIGAPSNALELRVSLTDGEVVGEVFSSDGTSYARAVKAVTASDPDVVAPAVRSVLARAVAELPEPVQNSVGEIRLDLAGEESRVLAALGLRLDGRVDPPSATDEALQARTGLAAGTPIRVN